LFQKELLIKCTKISSVETQETTLVFIFVSIFPHICWWWKWTYDKSYCFCMVLTTYPCYHMICHPQDSVLCKVLVVQILYIYIMLSLS